MKRTTAKIILSLFFLSSHLYSMDIQQKIVLHAQDGNFEIEKWKIFESINLHRDLLRREKICANPKNMALAYSDVTVKELELYSIICDKPKKKDFKNYFHSLSNDQQKLLITVAGEYDNNGKPNKLNCPGLTARLCDVYFKNLSKVWLKNNIKNKVQRLYWFYHCRHKLVEKNFSSILPVFSVEPPTYSYNEQGNINKMPEDFLGGSYNGESNIVIRTINGQDFKSILIKPIDEDNVYFLTSNSVHSETDLTSLDNELLLRLCNNTATQKDSVSIKHTNSIFACQFSKNGTYLLTNSDGETFLHKIVRKDEGISCTGYLLASISSVNSFNEQETALVSGSVENWDLCKGEIEIWDLSGVPCKVWKEKIGIPTGALFNHKGNRLATISHEKNTEGHYVSNLRFWDTTNINQIKLIKTIERDRLYDTILCSPNDGNWVATTNDGCVIFIDENENGNDYEIDENKIYTSNNENENKRILTVYSPNSEFIAVVIPEAVPKIIIFSAITKEELIKNWAWGKIEIKSIGFNENSDALFFKAKIAASDASRRADYKRHLLEEKDHKALDYLFCDTSIHQLALLRRLYQAYTNGEKAKIYEESASYKDIQELSKNEHVKEILEKYLPYRTVNNRKDIGEIMIQCGKEIEETTKVLGQKINDWWNQLRK